MEVEQQTHARPTPAVPTHRSPTGADAPANGQADAISARGAEPSWWSPPDSRQVLTWVDRHRVKLFIVVGLLYLLAFNGRWRLDADSALYLTIGRNLAEGRGYTYHGLPHSLAYPGMPWLFAGLFKVFGTDTVLPADVVMLACALATLALTYRLFLLHAGRPTAVLMTLALAVSRTFFRYSFELLSDMPFLMGVTAFLAGYESVFHRRYDVGTDGGQTESVAPRARPRWYDALLLLAGLGVAMVTRPTMWALLAAVVATVVLSLFTRPLRRGWVLVGAGFVAATITAGVLFYALDPRRGDHQADAGDYERVFLRTLTQDPAGLVRNMLGRNLPEVLHPGAAEAVFGVDWGHLGFASPYWIPMGIVPSLLSIGAGLWLFRRRLLWGMWVAMTVAMMLATLVEVRYFLQALPLLLYGWWLLLSWADSKARERFSETRWYFLTLPMAAFLALVAINAGRSMYLVIEQRSTPFIDHYRRGKYALVPKLTELLRAQTPDAAWVLVPERQLGRILTYTSGRYAVEPGPVTQLDPDTQVVYVLEPMDDAARQWLASLHIAVGDPVGPPVVGRRGVTWQLHRALRDQRTADAGPPR